MSTSPHLIFQSQAFPPVEGEDEEINPGIYGKALVEWLVAQLPSNGYEVKRLVAEDFGRLIQVKTPEGGLYIAVSSTDESATEWRVFCIANAGLKALLLGKAANSVAARDKLLDALQRIIQSHPGVSGCVRERP